MGIEIKQTSCVCVTDTKTGKFRTMSGKKFIELLPTLNSDYVYEVL